MRLDDYFYGYEAYNPTLGFPNPEEDQHRLIQYQYTPCLDIVAIRAPAF